MSSGECAGLKVLALSGVPPKNSVTMNRCTLSACDIVSAIELRDHLLRSLVPSTAMLQL
jgi:hypothetical protein